MFCKIFLYQAYVFQDPYDSLVVVFLLSTTGKNIRLHEQSSTPENWATTEFLSTELLHATEFWSTTVFSYTLENLYTTEFTSTAEFTSTEYFFFQIYGYTFPNLT